ncbi:hypothetical protein SAMN02745221_00567 [Thermosyntropha lipolytica DSM 11003]|uniref:Circadian input-output histidine kinase CikA n=1 Tax=Thermosyntropha lipolytica DSM 11003 TaxID=1123382 RepID=A0A1M5L6R4_9FIRM|nr:PAS domain S-box protein [Thermosyntropha lipolytica]SHG60459.1 hypothetical protein SAMN02745221_00567 [Thermosyntropha lipolytica DSM 11003]
MNGYPDYNYLISTTAMLYESEQKYQRLVENAMFGLVIFDMNNIYFSNKYITENLGYTSEDFWKNNLSIWDLLTPEYRKNFYPVAQKYFTTQKPYSQRFISELICKNGEVRTFEVAVSSISYNGQYAFQGNFIDITHFIAAQKKMEEKTVLLQKIEKKNRILVEKLNDGFLFVNTGFKITQLNPALARMLEYKPEELEGKCLLELAAYPRDVIALLIGMKKRMNLVIDSYELNLRTKSGRVIPTYISPSPFIEDNKVVGCFATIQDLSAIKETENKLAYQAHILANLSEGILITDEQGILTYINKGAQNILHINSNSFLNQHIYKLMEAFEVSIDENELFSHLNQNNSPWQKEIGFYNLNKEQIFVRISVTRMKDIYNNFKGLIIVISDLTEIIKAKKAAEAANLAKTNFLANVSHDIRTPMIGIMGAADLLSQEKLSPYQAELVQTIKQCGEQLLELINDILDLSRIEAGYALGRKKTFKLPQVINECIQTVYGKLPEEIALHTHIDPDVPLNLVGDPLQLRRIILNLLSNAIKFTTQGEIEVKVQVYKEPSNSRDDIVYLLFSVRDTGIGIPEDKLHTIFEAFEKIDPYSSSGTGLGLTICKQLTKNMGGDIWVESVWGKGSTFSFYLPFYKAKEDENKTGEASAYSTKNSPSSEQTKSILLVEDNDVNRKILSYMLYNAGYAVTAVENGIKCLEILQQKKFDLIIMDMQMPILDGYETCKRIRQDYHDNTPILALTAYAMEGDEARCLEAGCNYYLSKPVSSHKIYDKLKQIFAQESSLHPDEKTFWSANTLIKNLIPEFINSLNDLMLGMKISLEAEDAKQLASIAHDIKGSAGLYGFHNLANLASEIYREALNNNIDKIKIIYKEMLQNIEQIKQLL